MAQDVSIFPNVKYEVNTVGLQKAAEVIHAELEELKQLN